jgi:hypothetical protein
VDAYTREFVRDRAKRCCEYCGIAEANAPYLIFHVDHILARQHLDAVTDDPASLAWACSQCNYHKRPNLASIDPETLSQADLFHPRRDRWHEHFAIANGRVIGLTPQGRATARLLNMNAPRIVRLRRELADQGTS